MATGVAFCMAITLLPERVLENVPEENRHYLNDDFDAPEQSFAASPPQLSNFT
jgi:hypothetical protein